MAVLSVIAARTHPPEYSLHKYWSRKPHNIIRHYLRELVSDQSVVVDPCCGSGVVVREAALLGHEVHASDVNPVAVELSKLLIDPPALEGFCACLEEVLDWFEGECAERWKSPASSLTGRYAVHATIVECRACGATVEGANEQFQASSKTCPACDATVRFNLEWAEGTRVLGVSVQGRDELVVDPAEIAFHQAQSEMQRTDWPESMTRGFRENRRILAFNGKSVSSLFTSRNMDLLSHLSKRIEAIDDEGQRRAAKLLLTASVAQCSRLIAYRNNMKTGGPAWSVPGFWVPQLHLETNPAQHLRARFKRFLSGMKVLATSRPKGTVRIEQGTAQAMLTGLAKRGVQVDLVFLDPPYGESVPFVEFSSLWNAFLGQTPDLDDDLSVSNRLSADVGWRRYQTGLGELVQGTAEVLAQEGRVLITFNNHDLRAWRALLGALHEHRLACREVIYQIPAVVSSKAAFHPDSSYVGDLWAVCSKQAEPWAPSRNLDPVFSALEKCASSRNGVVALNLAYRTLAVVWMEQNLAVDLLDEWETIIDTLFRRVSDGQLELKAPIDPGVPLLLDIAIDVARETLRQGPCDWPKLYEEIARKCPNIGLPDPGELRQVLADEIRFSGRRCLALCSSGSPDS